MHKRLALISLHECPLASSEGKERGGINVYTFELAKALTKQGWQVDAYTRIQDDINPRTVQVSKDFRVIHLPNGPHTPLTKQDILSSLPEFSEHLLRFIQTERIQYDVIHGHYYLSGVVAMELNKLLPRPIPLVMTFHTLGLLKQLTVSQAQREDPEARIPFERQLVRESDRIIATSENSALYLTSLYDADPKKITTIQPGVDTALFHPGDKAAARRSIGATQDGYMILSVGRIDPVKGFDVLMYAMKILLHTDPELVSKICVCIIGGDVGEDKSLWTKELTKLDTLRNLLGLETTVQFIPPQPQQKLVEYYRASDVLVMPSHYESFGMVALEALVSGTPVITTDVTGISPIVRTFPKGHLISANNPILLARSLMHVLRHPPVPLGTTTVNIETLDWSSVARAIEKVYYNVTASD